MDKESEQEEDVKRKQKPAIATKHVGGKLDNEVNISYMIWSVWCTQKTQL